MSNRDTPRLNRMFEVDMRSYLTDMIPSIGFESLYDLAAAHEIILHSYTHNTIRNSAPYTRIWLSRTDKTIEKGSITETVITVTNPADEIRDADAQENEKSHPPFRDERTIFK
jgi:hypothetical protein